MRSRDLNTRIKIYGTETRDDGFRGSLIDGVFLGDDWANVKNKTGYQKLTDSFGVNIAGNALTVVIRNRNDIDFSAPDMFITIGESKYMIISHFVDVQIKGSFLSFVVAVKHTP